MYNNRLYEQAQYHMQRANLLENELSEEKAVNEELLNIIEALCNELGFTFEDLLEGSYETAEEQRVKREKSDDPTATRAGRSELNREEARKARMRDHFENPEKRARRTEAWRQKRKEMKDKK